MKCLKCNHKRVCVILKDFEDFASKYNVEWSMDNCPHCSDESCYHVEKQKKKTVITENKPLLNPVIDMLLKMEEVTPKEPIQNITPSNAIYCPSCGESKSPIEFDEDATCEICGLIVCRECLISHTTETETHQVCEKCWNM